ncbi:conserved hypothetical protein [uncultured Desulfatiglans sp.]|uniref:Uncharacterized protein n=1 Tax=Uncultured Desulfatiglans sp. TaxID=1748965 RepID=A0A653A185_UNCDX|nr:conserved hypothetical protein [uncultured Desulfatiglans sp.]
MQKTVAVVGTLDTKGPEIELLRDLITREGVRALVVDTGILDEAFLPADIPRERIAEAGGQTIERLVDTGDEAFAQRTMATGLQMVISGLLAEGRIHGLLAVGGGQGSVIVAPTLKCLPLGFPKVLVSTKVTQAGLWPYIGPKDVLVMPPVADLAGINRLTRRILVNAAGAIVGMVKMAPLSDRNRPLVVMSMNGTVTGCGLAVKDRLEALGYAVLVYHTIGTGGEALEDYVASHEVKAVVELGVNEVTNFMLGGRASAGPDRLTAAGKRGIPQVVAPGSADFINFLGPETVPACFQGRNLYCHNPMATLVRTSPEENRRLGEALAEKLNQACGPVMVLWPRRGLSTLDRAGKPYWDPEADAALLETLRQHLDPGIVFKELDAYINDAAFAEAVTEAVEEILKT